MKGLSGSGWGEGTSVGVLGDDTEGLGRRIMRENVVGKGLCGRDRWGGGPRVGLRERDWAGGAKT